jgi:hypothetical protein
MLRGKSRIGIREAAGAWIWAIVGGMAVQDFLTGRCLNWLEHAKMPDMAMPLTADRVPQRATGRMTYAEFVATDYEDNHSEWMDGNVIPMPPVNSRHQDISGFLLAVGVYVEEKKLGVIRRRPFQMKTGRDLPGRSPDFFYVANAHSTAR